MLSVGVRTNGSNLLKYTDMLVNGHVTKPSKFLSFFQSSDPNKQYIVDSVWAYFLHVSYRNHCPTWFFSFRLGQRLAPWVWSHLALSEIPLKVTFLLQTFILP